MIGRWVLLVIGWEGWELLGCPVATMQTPNDVNKATWQRLFPWYFHWVAGGSGGASSIGLIKWKCFDMSQETRFFALFIPSTPNISLMSHSPSQSISDQCICFVATLWRFTTWTGRKGSTSSGKKRTHTTQQTYPLPQTNMSPSPHYHLSLSKTPLFALQLHERRYLSLFVNINSKKRERQGEGCVCVCWGGEEENQSNTAELSDHMKLWILGLSIQPLSAELCKSIQTDTKSKHTLNATIGNWSEQCLPF